MRTKDEILQALMGYAADLPPEHKQLALVAITETEIQLDIRDILYSQLASDQERAFKLQQLE